MQSLASDVNVAAELDKQLDGLNIDDDGLENELIKKPCSKKKKKRKKKVNSGKFIIM